MMFAGCLSLLIPCSIGYLAVCRLCERQFVPGGDFLLKISLGVFVGFGICSCLFFLWLVTVGYRPPVIIGAEAGLCIALGVSHWRRGGRGRGPYASPASSAAPGYLRFVFWVLFGMSLAYFLLKALRHPHGGWDAWMMWNMKARFIFRGGKEWAQMFSSQLDWSHQDYPLFLPISVARVWMYVGRETVVGPILLSLLFTYCGFGVLMGALVKLAGEERALLAGCLLAGTPFLAVAGAIQNADVPLGMFFLCAAVGLLLHERTGNPDGRWMVLSGLCAGLTCWTKNEGLLVICVLLLGQCAIRLPRVGAKRTWREIVSFGFGALPGIVCLIILRARFSLSNEIVSMAELGEWMRRLLSPHRYVLIGDRFLAGLVNFGAWRVSPVAALTLFGLTRGIDARRTGDALKGLIVVGAMIFGYAFIFLITPYELVWHLSTSLDRLFMHLWPVSILFWINAMGPRCRSPKTIVASFSTPLGEP